MVSQITKFEIKLVFRLKTEKITKRAKRMWGEESISHNKH